LEYFWQHKQKGYKNANAVVDLALRLKRLVEKAAGACVSATAKASVILDRG
jgi:hypothetical protein